MDDDKLQSTPMLCFAGKFANQSQDHSRSVSVTINGIKASLRMSLNSKG